METSLTYTAFAGEHGLASGQLEAVVLAAKDRIDQGGADRILIFEDQTGSQLDFDWRGTRDEVLARLRSHPYFAPPPAAEERRVGPGRPKLGVVSREVSLLPRHWDWLNEQPGGASGALRKLVEEARRHGLGAARARKAREAAGAFMSVMAGDLPGYEEASRALYARDQARLTDLIRAWPKDIRAHVERLVTEAVRLDAAAVAEAEGRPATE